MTLLLTALIELEPDRGAMAALRKALIPTQRQQCWRYLARMGCRLAEPDDVTRYSILAHCWGHYPVHSESAGNLGNSLNQITQGDTDHPFEKRFQRLLASDSLEELAEQIKGTLPLVKRVGAPLNFDLLNEQLSTFTDNSEQVKLRWASTFYAKPKLQEVAP